MNYDNDENNFDDELLESLKYLMWKLAKKYATGGAEYEELLQSLYLRAIEIARRLGNYEEARRYAAKSLPGYAIDEADRLRGEGTRINADIEDLEELFPDLWTQHGYEKTELSYDIHKKLNQRERQILRARLDGLTQREIAVAQGIKQPTVAEKLKTIARKLLPLLKPDLPERSASTGKKRRHKKNHGSDKKHRS